jgi:hypothetical protein
MRVTTEESSTAKIEAPDEELAEGMVMTILTPEDRETFTLGPERRPPSWPRSRRTTAAK